MILEIAERCATVDDRELASLLAHGQGRAEVYRQWRTAQGPDVQGSPHLFTAAGVFAVHNPGVTYHWTARPPLGFPLQQHGLPVFENYDPTWAGTLLDALGHGIPTE